MNHGLWTSVMDNVVFVAVSVLIAAALFLIAYVSEKALYKRHGITERILTTRKIAVIGVFSAISAVLMLFEFPVPFAPPFYELDFSEVPVLIGAFALGPWAGVIIEAIKILLNLVINEASTGENDKPDYVNLEFRHNAYNDSQLTLGTGLASFKLDNIAEQLKEKKGLNIRVKSLYDGERFMTIDIKKENN